MKDAPALNAAVSPLTSGVFNSGARLLSRGRRISAAGSGISSRSSGSERGTLCGPPSERPKNPKDTAALCVRQFLTKTSLISLAVSLFVGAWPAQAKVPEVGTIITKANWTEYRDVMPDGLVALFEGKYFWKVPDDVEIEVGPMTQFKDPQKYIEDTEKYAGQATLREGEGGGIVIENYTAGLPFPDPQEPQLAAKLFYNNYYRYVSPYLYFDWKVYFVDRYHNETTNAGYSVYTRMNHLSEPGMPHKMPGVTDEQYYSVYQEVLEPEQSRYTAQLLTYFNDVTKEEQNYAFVPSMRRSLRLSSASRCSPILGTDWTPEDIARVPGQFTPKFLREQKILMIVNANGLERQRFTTPQLFPTRQVGKWEVRDVWVVDAQRAPGFSDGYCYGGRHLYIDKQTYAPIWTDTYDVNGKLFKILANFLNPVRVPDHPDVPMVMPQVGGTMFVAWDVQDDHISGARQVPTLINTDIDARFRSPTRYAMPTGLNEVMR